jgi:hypothetical protein
MIRTTLLAVVAVLGLASTSYAAGELALDAPLMNGAARRAFAQDLSVVFATLNSQLPELSPSQQAWLKREYDEQIAEAGGRYTKRALSATDSVEYQLRVAKPHASELLKALNLLSSATELTPDDEVALWSLVAYFLIDQQFWQSVDDLVQRGVVDRKIGYVDSLYFENYGLRAQEIRSKIIIPHLQGELPE